MNKKFKFLTGVALISTMFFAMSCNDEWDNHYNDGAFVDGDAGQLNPSMTLLDAIKAEDSQLHDFYKVVDACGCADSLLNQTRVYTLWAPKDGTFNVDSLLGEIEEGRRDNVLKRFVKAHMTNYLHPANGTLPENNNILLLNKKVINFTGSNANYTFDNVALSAEAGEYNVRLSNGLLHKLEHAIEYKVNIWEYLAQDERISQMSDFLYSHNERRFEPGLAIVGPTVNGEVTYLDSASAFVNSNFWFKDNTYDKKTTGFGQIDVEDSTFTMFAITNEVWDKMVEKTTKYYNFRYADNINEVEKEYYDSLQYLYARKMLCNHLVFNNNEQRYEDVHSDSLMSTCKYYGNTYKVVRRKFAKNELMDGVIDSKELSNGIIYIKDNYNFCDFDIWHDTIKLEAENSNNYEYSTINTIPTSNYVNKVSKNKDVEGELSGNTYLQIAPKAEYDSPEVTFTIPNTLSASYNIRLVFVPAHITNQQMKVEELKPTRISVSLTEGKSLEPFYKTDMIHGLMNDPTRIDSVYLFDVDKDRENGYDVSLREPAKIKFDRCEYGYTTEETTVQLKLRFDADEEEEMWWGPDPNLDRSFRLDCIILEPVADDELE